MFESIDIHFKSLIDQGPVVGNHAQILKSIFMKVEKFKSKLNEIMNIIFRVK